MRRFSSSRGTVAFPLPASAYLYLACTCSVTFGLAPRLQAMGPVFLGRNPSAASLPASYGAANSAGKPATGSCDCGGGGCCPGLCPPPTCISPLSLGSSSVQTQMLASRSSSPVPFCCFLCARILYLPTVQAGAKPGGVSRVGAVALPA